MNSAIIVPVYNEEKTIKKVLMDCRRKSENVIAVLDAPTDRSADIVREIPGITVLENTTNKGLTETLKVGFRFALSNKFDFVVKIDSDDQMNIDRYDDIVAGYRKTQADVVSAIYDRDTPWFIKKDMWIFSSLYYIATGVNCCDLLSEYRLFSPRAMMTFIDAPIRCYASNIGIIELARNGCTLAEVVNGVSYRFVRHRPAHLNALLDIRMQFIESIWQYRGYRARSVVLFAVPLLLFLLLMNITAGFRYNSCLPRCRLR